MFNERVFNEISGKKKDGTFGDGAKVLPLKCALGEDQKCFCGGDGGISGLLAGEEDVGVDVNRPGLEPP